MDFWTIVSRIILKGRFLVLAVIIAFTYYLSLQMEHMRFSYTEANLLPENHEINVDYDKFLDLFGEEGNLVILAVQDSTIFTSEKFNAWNNLSNALGKISEVDFTVAVGDIQKLEKKHQRKKV